MKFTGGALMIAVGLFLLYLLVTGKMDCFYGAFMCAFQPKQFAQQQSQQGQSQATPRNRQGLPALPFPRLQMPPLYQS